MRSRKLTALSWNEGPYVSPTGRLNFTPLGLTYIHVGRSVGRSTDVARAYLRAGHDFLPINFSALEVRLAAALGLVP